MTQATVAKPSAGVLPISAVATQKSPSTSTATPAKSAPKAPAPRLKLIIRRIPPGLTQSEFETYLGDEWKNGSGKIDWLLYRPGKVSKDPAKPSRPSRAYLHVTSEDLIAPLSDAVRAASFHDARNTYNDPVLLGPPSLEFAPYARTPSTRVRKDGRQGTIDQDPEFIAFLESLTNPIPPAKSATAAGEPGAGAGGETDQKEGAVEEQQVVTITPLVQYIKDKKANKGKEGAAAGGGKSGRHGKGGASEKEKKAEAVQAKKLLKRSAAEKEAAGGAHQSSTSSDKKAKSGEKSSREAVKIAKQLSASGTGKGSKQASSNATTTASTTSSKDGAALSGTASTPAAERRRERGDVSAAARILQRDLGLAPAGGRRRGGKAATAATTETETKSEKSQDSPQSPSKPSKQSNPTKPVKDAPSAKASTVKGGATQPTDQQPQQQAGRNTPADKSPPAVPPAAARAPRATKQSKANPPSPTATQAFLKHANPSQGVTEPLLEEAFSAFGKLLKVEIDKKKGYGYVDFAEPEGLQNAIAASPVPVGQGQVVVLERKVPPSSQQPKKKAEQQQAKAATQQQQTQQGAAAQPQQEKDTPQQSGKGGGEGGRGRGGRGGRGRGRGGAGKEGTKGGGAAGQEQQGSKEPAGGEKTTPNDEKA